MDRIITPNKIINLNERGKTSIESAKLDREIMTSDFASYKIKSSEKLDLKINEDAKAIKLAKRREREKKEELLENLEHKKPEKPFGIKETFAVLFTILFALVNVYLWMLINARNK